MASSNILLFDANKANMMSDEQYNTNTQRLNGVQSGIASSQLQNKTLYQCSLVAYAIAQVMNQNGLDANDTAAVSAFVANLSGTMLQKVADLATTEEAKAGVSTGKWMSPALVKAAMDTFTANKWLPLAGGTMQGNLILNANPTANLGAATKQYVDTNIKNIEKRYKLYSGTKSYINFTSGSLVVDKIYNLPNLKYSDVGFIPTKLLIKADIQNYTAQNGLEINISTDGYRNIPIRMLFPDTNTDQITFSRIQVDQLFYIKWIKSSSIAVSNQLALSRFEVVMPASLEEFSLDSEFSLYFTHYSINARVSVDLWLS